MLGSLSRWLRIGGYDTEYKRDVPDDDLIEEALKADRILLTRDESLVRRARKRGVDAIFINHEGDKDALSQLSNELDLIYDPAIARCPKCNHTVEKVTKEEVADRVPEGTFKTIDDFWLHEMREHLLARQPLAKDHRNAWRRWKEASDRL
jgi:uncharacterized protein with PIN domain